jgi:hypothetical protein
MDGLAKVQFSGPTRDWYKHPPGLTIPLALEGMAEIGRSD